MKTVARKDGDDFIINGDKLWITNAGHAGLFLVFANANPQLMNENPKQVSFDYFNLCNFSLYNIEEDCFHLFRAEGGPTLLWTVIKHIVGKHNPPWFHPPPPPWF